MTEGHLKFLSPQCFMVSFYFSCKANCKRAAANTCIFPVPSPAVLLTAENREKGAVWHFACWTVLMVIAAHLWTSCCQLLPGLFISTEITTLSTAQHVLRNFSNFPNICWERETDHLLILIGQVGGLFPSLGGAVCASRNFIITAIYHLKINADRKWTLLK